MSSSNGSATGPAGVRNLRALFEHKASEDSSSPSRGRSPSGLSDASNQSRPVSKVRASFFAVEKAGEPGQPPQWGLRQVDENMAETSAEMLAGPGEKEYRNDVGGTETSPQENQPEPHPDAMPDSDIGAILKGSSFDGVAMGEGKVDTSNPSMTRSEANETTKPSEPPDVGQASSRIRGARVEENSGPAPGSGASTSERSLPEKTPSTPSKVDTSTKSPSTTQSPTTARSPMKTPTSGNSKPRIRGGPGKILAVMESARKAREARSSMASQVKTGETVNKSEAGQSDAKKPETKANHMPQPTSPKTSRPSNGVTRPVRLPAGATASTAASTARNESNPSSPKTSKTAKPTNQSERHPAPATAPTAPLAGRKEPKQTLRQSDVKASVRRNPSTRQAPKVASVGTASSLAKNASRGSINSTSGERPKSRISTTKPDEGFLARMMRPTASSAQKTHDKVQVNSPPRGRGMSTTKPKDQGRGPPRMNPLTIAEVNNKENKENEDGAKADLPNLEPISPFPTSDLKSTTSAVGNMQQPLEGSNGVDADGKEGSPASHTGPVPNGHAHEEETEATESPNQLVSTGGVNAEQLSSQ